jgi:predicted glutamine amidotransferase
VCRLLGFVADRPRTLQDLLGDDLADFTALSLKHGDGWGFATPGAAGFDVRKSPDAARASAEFAAVAGELAADVCMVHLRWATMGLATTLDNTHPFTLGSYAFGHNGSIDPPRSIDPLVAPDLLAARRGETDSERYFLALLTQLRAGLAPLDALASTVDALAQLPHSSLNCMLTTPDALYAVSSHDPAAEDEAEEDHYYRLHWTVRDGAVVVSSSGWGSGWEELGNDEVLVVDRASGAVSRHELHALRATA